MKQKPGGGIIYKVSLTSLKDFDIISNKEGKEMYRCKECCHLFEDGEQASVLTFGSDGRPVARELVCPVCGGNYDETTPCKICGRECLEDELSSEGYCMDCLRGELDGNTFYRFAFSEDVRPESVTTLEDFVFVKIFGLAEELGGDERVV